MSSRSSGSPNVTIATFILILVVAGYYSNQSSDKKDLDGRNSGSSSAIRSPGQADGGRFQGVSVPDIDDLAGEDEEVAEYSRWAGTLAALDLANADATNELADLSRNYGGSTDDAGLIRSVAGKGRLVRMQLAKAKRHIRAGNRATNKNHFAEARREFSKATIALKELRGPLRKDLVALERRAGTRILPKSVFSRDGSYQTATVKVWIDGDTINTSVGRVRLLGIDTPEMTSSCEAAREAKSAAEQLAPPGSTVRLFNPTAVRDKDRYGRLLRYVDTAESGSDVGLSLLINHFAVPRYDSRDGYQWHPREAAYREMGGGEPGGGSTCVKPTEKGAFVGIVALSRVSGTDEFKRARVLGRDLDRPYRTAARTLDRYVDAAQRAHERSERRAQARAKARAATARREAQQRSQPAPRPRASQPDAPSHPYPGYTGPRCYAPGGKTWRPC